MKLIRNLFLVVGLTSIALVSVAQEEEESEMFTYATYFNCGGGPLSVADDTVAADAERMNGLVEDGTLAGWGWLAHHTGGQWRRIFYYQAESLDALLDGGDAIDGDDDGDDADADAAADDADDGPTFFSVCNNHDDYIWQVENAGGGDNRGAAGFSVYHVCDINREERADEIVDEHVAPILDKMVADGSLSSWGWMSHVVGGRFRRLQTMTAPDHKSLLAARGAAIDAMYAEDSEAGTEFSEICGPHVDYMWDILHEG